MNQEPSTTSRTVELRRDGQFVAVIPAVPELRGQFAMKAHIGVADKAHGLRIVAEQDEVLLIPIELEGQLCLQAYAGLETRLETALLDAGYDVMHAGERPALPPISDSDLAAAQAGFRAMLQFVQSHNRGLIEYDPSRVQVESLIAQIAQAFPDTTILVLTTRKNDARRLGRCLRDAGLDLYVSLDGYEPEAGGPWRIVVTTYGGAGAGIANLRYRQLVLYPNADEVFCCGGTLGLDQLDQACIFGFRPANASPPREVRTLTAAIFGDEVVTVLRPDVPARTVDVVFLPSRVQAPVLAGEDDRALRERLAWQHPVRNRRIARVARLLAKNDQDLDRSFPDLAAKLDPYGWHRVAVLVGSVEQGLELKKYLSDWPLLVAKGFAPEGLSNSQLAKLHEQPGKYWDLSAPAIVTPGALPEAGHFSGIVRADAGTGCPPLGEERLARGERPSPVLIVDFDDRHHPVLRRWTRERKTAYRSHGWRVEGGPDIPAECRLPARQAPRRCVLAYQSPTKERWVKGPLRTAEYHYHQRRKRQRDLLRRDSGSVITIEQVADRDHLVDCFRQIQREGGPAPGIDGISPADVSLREFGHIAEKLSKVLMSGRYRPQPTRRVAIDKPGSDEKRVLKIGVLLDRVVGKALHEALQPIWETIYLPQSFGFRPGRSPWQMLAAIMATMEAEDRWVLAVDDVRKAFDNVPIAQTLGAHQAATKRTKKSPTTLSRQVLDLIGVVLRGFDENSQVGIDQGGCYSPDALNLLLHVVHDAPFSAADDTTPWYRYADNVLYLCRSVSEGSRMLDRSRSLLARVHLSLKGEDGIVDVDSGEAAQVLGFAISRIDGRVQLGLGRTALPRLRRHLVEVCSDPDPVEAARCILRLWIGAYGPAFEDGEAVLRDLIHTAVEAGHREIPERPVLLQWMEKEYQRWSACRERVDQQTVRC